MQVNEDLELAFLGYLIKKRPPVSLLTSLKKEFKCEIPEVAEIVKFITDEVGQDFPVPDRATMTSLLPRFKSLLNTAQEVEDVAGDLNGYAVLFHRRSIDKELDKLATKLKDALDKHDIDNAAIIGDELARLKRSGKNVVVPVDTEDFINVDTIIEPEEFLTTHIPRLNQHLSGWPNDSDFENTGGFSLGELAIIGGSTNMGKGIPISEYLPTPTGKTIAKEIKVGDKLFGRHGEEVTVTHVSEIHNRPCYKIIFNDGTSIVTDDEHKWLVYQQQSPNDTRFSSEPTVKTTYEMFDYGVVTDKGRSCFKIPITAPVEYRTNNKLPIPPYVLGYWLGDGTSAGSTITVSSEDSEEVMSYFQDEPSYIIVTIYIKSSKPSIRVIKLGTGDRSQSARSICIQSKLRSLDLLNNKHIPEIYKVGSIEQRINLIRGLMDSDGCCEKNGSNRFYNKNERLIDDIIEVITSLGGLAYKFKKRTKCNGTYFDSFYLEIKTNFNPFRLLRKADNAVYGISRPFRFIRSIEEVESIPTICFMVSGEDKLYLVSKNYIVTHNSAIARSFWYNFIEKSTKSDKYKSAYINYEGAYSRFRKEFFAMVTGIYPSKKDPAIYASAAEEYKRFLANRKDKFVVYDGAAGEMPTTTSSLENEIYKRAEEGYKIFFIDTINSVDDTSGKESWHITEMAMRMLERASKRYNLCIIATAQNKQGLQFEESQWPELKWIGQSSYLQQKAGVAIGIYRADLFSNGNADYTSLAIMKSRVRSVQPKESVNVTYDVRRRMYIPYEGNSLDIISASEKTQNKQILTAVNNNIETAYASV